jgi:hypothetical protein
MNYVVIINQNELCSIFIALGGLTNYNISTESILEWDCNKIEMRL